MANINDPEIQALLSKGKLRSIIKTLPGGRRFLLGFERSKRSSKYHQKYLIDPIDLNRLGKEDQTVKLAPEAGDAPLPPRVEKEPVITEEVPAEPIATSRRTTPPRQLLIEALANMPDFMTLQAGLTSLFKEFPLARREEKLAWQKVADEKVLGWIKTAATIPDINFIINSTQTFHAWPTTDKMKRKFTAAATQRESVLTANPHIILK